MSGSTQTESKCHSKYNVFIPHLHLSDLATLKATPSLITIMAHQRLQERLGLDILGDCTVSHGGIHTEMPR